MKKVNVEGERRPKHRDQVGSALASSVETSEPVRVRASSLEKESTTLTCRMKSAKIVVLKRRLKIDHSR